MSEERKQIIKQSASEQDYLQKDSRFVADELKTPVSLSDKYRFIEEIGHGAQGKIFKSERLEDHRSVVIKQLNVSSIKTCKEY